MAMTTQSRLHGHYQTVTSLAADLAYTAVVTATKHFPTVDDPNRTVVLPCGNQELNA